MLDQRPRLLNISFCWQRRLQFERGHCSREAFIRLTNTPANSSLVVIKNSFDLHKLELCHEKVFQKH